MSTATPFLMFQGQAQAAIDLYTATLPNTCVLQLERHPSGGTGEGSVKLELTGSSEYAVYYLLYRSDDVTPGREVRAVYLNHVSDGEMHFPPGNYVLKIARGDYWISDEEGFGENGAYSKSVPTEMTAGVYSIEISTTSGFGRDSWGGLG